MPNFRGKTILRGHGGIVGASIDLEARIHPDPGQKQQREQEHPQRKATTRRACRPTKSTDFRARKGRKRKVIVSGARGLENRHQSCISAGTVKSVWNIIMNIPTVRMKPNSARALKLEVASAAVAVAAVRMQKKTLDPVVSKVRNTAAFSVPPLAHSCGTRLKKCTTWSSPKPAKIAIKDRLIRLTSPG